MKRAAAVFLLGVAVCVTPAYAVTELLGVITATDAAGKTQGTTAVTFTIPAGSKVMVQCDSPAYVKWGATSTSLPTSSSYTVKLAKDQVFVDYAGQRLNYLGVLGVTASTTVNCYVSQVLQ